MTEEPAQPAPAVTGTGAGARLVQASWVGTALFAATAAAAAAWPSALDVPAFLVALALFFTGLVFFVSALLIAVGRSREEEIALTSLFLLSGSPGVRQHLLGSLAVEMMVALVTAAARPYTSLAFGVLVPLYGLAVAGLWAARHGTFPRRATDPRRPAR